MMKKNYNLLAMALVVTMVLVGCGGGLGNDDKPTENEVGNETNTGVDDPKSVLRDGEMTELRIAFPGGSASPASLELVEEQLNKIVGEHMDATVKLDIYEFGVFGDQQNLIMSSGEDVALMFTWSSSRNFAASKQVLDITELCEIYAKDAVASIEKYVDACRIDGQIYGLPTFHEYSRSAGLICRTDMLEELNIDPETVTTWGAVEKVLAAAKEKYPDKKLLCPADDTGGIVGYHTEGKFDIATEGVGVAIDDESMEFVNIYNSSEFMEMAEMAYDWNQKGYVMNDATTVTETRSELLAAGNTFGYIGLVHPGTETQELKNAGVDVTAMSINETALATSNVDYSQYMVPTACSTPEKAVKLLDLMLTNADFNNLLSYGIMGIDYEIKDEANGIVGYPEGVDNSNVGWNNETWLTGNGSLGYVWETDPEAIWEDYKALNDGAKVSPVYGFALDTSGVKSEISAISNVVTKYKLVITAGYSEPAEAVRKMNEELEAAGINKVIEEANAQVEVWKANQ